MSSASLVPRKRPRPVKSCLNCRSKKLKCDREQPCSQCVKYHRADSCGYDETSRNVRDSFNEAVSPSRVSESRSGEPSPADGVLPTSALVPSGAREIAELRTQVQRLEKLFQRRADNLLPITASTVPDSSGEIKKPSYLQYHGLNNTRSLMALFPEVAQYSCHTLDDPTFKADFAQLQIMFPKKKQSLQVRGDVDLMSILAAVPRHTLDQYVNQYYTYFERPYRILHLTTFIRKYHQFLDNRQAMDDSLWAAFIPQFALAALIGAQINKHQHSDVPNDFSANPSKVCSMVDHWLSSLGSKQRSQPNAILTSCLLVLAKRLLAYPSTDVWRATGDLVRLALTLRLQIDPEELDPKMSPFQAELRRRIWYTIAELDLEASLSCGMPSLLQSITYTCHFPKEEDIYDSSVDPISHGEDGKRTSFQVALSQSLPLRIQALNIVSKCEASFLEVNKLLGELELYRSATMQKFHTISEQSMIFQSVMMDMCYRRPMILLFTYVLQYFDMANLLSNTEFAVTATKCVFFCMAVMSNSDTLDPHLSELEAITDDKAWKVFDALNGDDVIRAAHCACYAMNLVDKASKQLFDIEQTRPAMALDVPKSAVRRMIDDTMRSIIKRKPDLRPVLKQLLVLAGAADLTKQTGLEDGRKKLMHFAVIRIMTWSKERHQSDAQNRRQEYSSSDSFHTPQSDFFMDPTLNQDFSLDFEPTLGDWNLELFADVAGLPSLPFNSNVPI
ncbi:hypothetical protein BT63DRAFT_451179 [Microthyrium microscopicum]|uniref:Zn(2)-C6 fungal-type domain-containing protein n=1 Tax=Microthyrium microscopicum TaxID=703497 RepID=A0A6A6UN69_9PEZI|nr:hypothetical protein BT63DRAFT_451179 [Microthyrium microscopicum]